MDTPIRPLLLAGIAIVAWILSPWIGTTVPIIAIVVLGLGFVSPFPFLQFKHEDGKFEWTFLDWIGLAILICVMYALAKGVDPLALIRALGKLAGK